MSNCCTPESVKVDLISPTGEIVVFRGTGNAPSCGYYKDYAGTQELDYYDYYTVDIQYNSGSGVWTFSGNSTGFNDPTIYIKEGTGNDPCYPYGLYTGGINEIYVSKTENPIPIYEFESSFTTGSSIYDNAIGSGVHLNKDVKFNFLFNDIYGNPLNTRAEMLEAKRFNGIVYDVLDQKGSTIKENFFSGYTNTIIINEKDNINIFGSYRPNFGVRAKSLDSKLGVGGVSEFYVYGNSLEIELIEISDGGGKRKIYNTDTGSSVSGFNSTGFIEQAIDMSIEFRNNVSYVNSSHIDFYFDKTPNFETNNLKPKRLDLRSNQRNQKTKINKNWGIKENEDYYFALKPFSKIGEGKTIRFGPLKIKKKQEKERPITGPSIDLSYKDSTLKIEYKTGQINSQIENNSGILDRLIVDTGRYGVEKQIYKNEVELDFLTVPTTTGGQWLKTSFDYYMEFKDIEDPYKNLTKKVKLSATGTSVTAPNSGMPLFSIEQEPTGVDVDLGIIYNASGLYLVANTGHQYDTFKFQRTSL